MGNPKKYAIILAGGIGARSGADRPKQFVKLAGLPMLFHSMNAFYEADHDVEIMVVLHPDFQDYLINYVRLHPGIVKFTFTSTKGGSSRAESVLNGLIGLRLSRKPEPDAIVAIHDAARPLVTPEMIRRGYAASERGIGCVPVVECVNSLRHLCEQHVEKSGLVNVKSEAIDRSRYVEVQTPQIFNFDELYFAYRGTSDLSKFTDDASIAESRGMKIRLYEGETTNIKVTNPIDFDLAKIILKARKK